MRLILLTRGPEEPLPSEVEILTAWLSYGAAWPSYGAAWLNMVRRGSVMVRRGSVWCGVAQLVARRLAVRQARVRFSARHHREVFPTELTSDEEMERRPGE